MSHTYYQLLYHFVWSTKERRPIITANIKDSLYDYMGGTFRSLKCTPVLFGGVADHVHICVEVPPRYALAEIIRNVKVSSTKWVRQNYVSASGFEWQEGYGAFSVSPSAREAVLKYIRNQEAHHSQVNFKEEFLWLLKNHAIKYDEKYLWK